MTSADGSPRIHHRQVLEQLPRYVAGKPPAATPGVTAYKLSSNENPMPPVPAVLRAIAEADAVNRYPEPDAASLSAAVGDFLSVPADHVVGGTGSLGALNQVIAAIAGRNEDGTADEVIYAWRSFESYPISVQLAGAVPVPVPLLADGRHDLEAMAAAITDRTRLILLCTPNNPTGPALRRGEIEAFLARVPREIPVVIDEAYAEFVRDPEAVNGLDFYRTHRNVIVLRTFSKAHGLAGLRVGYSVAQPEITQWLRVVAPPFAVSSLAAHAAITSLQHYDEVAARVQLIVDERARVTRALEVQGWKIPDAQGNFVWLPIGDDALDFAGEADSRGLSVRAFAGDGVRVSIGETEANSRLIGFCAEWIAARTNRETAGQR